MSEEQLFDSVDGEKTFTKITHIYVYAYWKNKNMRFIFITKEDFKTV